MFISALTDRRCDESIREPLLEEGRQQAEAPAHQHPLPTTRVAIATAIGGTLFALGRWYTAPALNTVDGTLLDRFLPNAEFNGEVSVVIHASPAAIFAALRTVTLADMPLAKLIGETRYLPARLAGKGEQKALDSEPFMSLVMAGNTTIVLAEVADRELVVGSVGKYHNLKNQQMVALGSPAEFLGFDHPEYQKLAMSLRISGGEPATGYRFTLEHRTHALSPAARWKFAFYWLGIKPGGNFVSWLILRAIKRRAEASAKEELISGQMIAD